MTTQKSKSKEKFDLNKEKDEVLQRQKINIYLDVHFHKLHFEVKKNTQSILSESCELEDIYNLCLTFPLKLVKSLKKVFT